ncbi:unnamed protein product [Discosporangium mesarthrocarpum]
MQPPQTIGGLCTFLGMTGYFRQFIPQYSQIAAPMIDLLRGKEMAGEQVNRKELDWDAAQKTSFEALKQKVITPPVLGCWFPDWSMTFCLCTDASILGAGAGLSQV